MIKSNRHKSNGNKHPNNAVIIAENFNGGIKQHISKSPKQDDEKQVYQIYANFTTSTGIPVSPIDYL